MNKNNDMQNLFIAMLLSLVVLMYWQYFIEAPRKKAEALSQRTKAAVEMQIKKDQEKEVVAPRSRSELITDAPRVKIESPSLNGSLVLKGLRIDDVTLAHYHETPDHNSPEVVLLSPAGGTESYFIELGWMTDKAQTVVPGPDTLWKADGTELNPTHPLTLSWVNPAGVNFTVHVALDDKYMFTFIQSAHDATGKALELQSYAYVNRVYDLTTHPTLGILHEGPLGVFDGTLSESGYRKLVDEKEKSFEGSSGWVGITDKYWLAAIVPPVGSFTSHFSYYISKGLGHFQVDYLGPVEAETTMHFFTGAKELSILDDYAAQYQIPLFDHAVDFGWFYFLTKPLFLTMQVFHKMVGNFGIAILLLTVAVKLLMFPLASKSFKSMSQMKTLQPKMAELRERLADDKMKMNQEIMELYKREKVNPAAGCLPMFIQIPVFFSLYKVLYVTIEMRHAPFFGWIHDLSARDPTNLFTLFGLLNWQPPTVMHLGVWPMLMCISMVIQQHQSPPPPDPMQAKMMKLLPFIFLFVFSSLPAGLVIYSTWSNFLTIMQQWYITSSHEKAKSRKKT